MNHIITLIAGDGIGEEVAVAMQHVVAATGVNIQWDVQPAGLKCIEALGSSLPQTTLDSIRQHKVALKGPTTTPIASGHQSTNVVLRKTLDLYASVRPVRSVPGITTRYDDVDLIIVRENTEGLYAGQELEITPGTVISLKVATQKACERIARSAFELAMKLGRKRVTLGHKANILKRGDGLFLAIAQELSKEFPQIEFEDVIVDALCMKLVTDPSRFDVLLLENLYGDILSDLCAGLVGGLGVVPGANLGDGIAVFEAVHGSAPDIAGKGLANPMAMMKSAAMMLEYIGEKRASDSLSAAIEHVLTSSSVRTRDLGGVATTDEFTDSICQVLKTGL